MFIAFTRWPHPETYRSALQSISKTHPHTTEYPHSIYGNGSLCYLQTLHSYMFTTYGGICGRLELICMFALCRFLTVLFALLISVLWKICIVLLFSLVLPTIVLSCAFLLLMVLVAMSLSVASPAWSNDSDYLVNLGNAGKAACNVYMLWCDTYSFIQAFPLFLYLPVLWENVA